MFILSCAKLATTTKPALDTGLFATILVTFLCSHVANMTLTPHKRFAILLALLDAWIAIEFGLVGHQATILHDGLGNRAFACKDCIKDRE